METAMGPPIIIEHNGLALEVSHLRSYLKVPGVWKNVLFSEMHPCSLNSQSSIVVFQGLMWHNSHERFSLQSKAILLCSPFKRSETVTLMQDYHALTFQPACWSAFCFPASYLLGFPSGRWARHYYGNAGRDELHCAPDHNDQQNMGK